MDYRLPIAKRTRSRRDQFYREYFRKIKEERNTEKNNVSDSVSDNNANQPRRRKEMKQVEKGKDRNGSEKCGSDCKMDCESIACSEEASVEDSKNVTNSQTAFGGVSDLVIIDENSTEEEGGEHEEDDSVGSDTQSLHFMGREGEDVEVTKAGNDQRVKVGVKRKKKSELEILVDSHSEKYNDIDEIDEDYSNSAKDFSCVAKRTRSQFNVTREKKKAVEHESKGCVGEGLEDDEQEVRKPVKKKRSSVKKKYDVSKILLDPMFESEAGLEELVCKRNFCPRAETNPLGDEVTLPLKFTYVDEQPNSPEISDFDREMNALWADLELALRSSEIIASRQQVEDEDSFPPEKEVDSDRATLCSQGKHEAVLDEEIGLRYADIADV